MVTARQFPINMRESAHCSDQRSIPRDRNVGAGSLVTEQVQEGRQENIFS